MSITKSTTQFKLEYPIEFKGAAIAELTIRRPKGRDLRFIPSGESFGIEEMFPFFALLIGHDEAVLDEIDAADLTRLGDIINGFLPQTKKKRAR